MGQARLDRRVTAFPRRSPPPMALDLDPVFDQAGKAFNVDPGILKGIAQTESGNLPDPDNAVSSAGAIGRMQIMPDVPLGAWGSIPVIPCRPFGAPPIRSRKICSSSATCRTRCAPTTQGPDTSRWNNPETAAYVQKVASNYAPVGEPSENGAPVSGSATPQLDAALAAAQAGKLATPPQQQAPSGDAYSTLFGSTDPGSGKPAAVAPSATTAGTDAYSQMFGSTDPAAPKPTTPTAPPGGVLSDVNQAVNAAGARNRQCGYLGPQSYSRCFRRPERHGHRSGKNCRRQTKRSSRAIRTAPHRRSERRLEPVCWAALRPKLAAVWSGRPVAQPQTRSAV